MNKKYIICILFCILFASINANEFKTLKPLSEDEYLMPEIEAHHLIIKTSKEVDKTYFENENVIRFQISEDKKKILFQIYDERFRPNFKIYILNSNDGAIKELGNLNTNWMADSGFRYLLTNSINTQNRMLELIVLDLETFTKLHTFSWLSQQKNFEENFAIDGKGFNYYFTISNDKNYDFIIYARGYDKQYGYAYLNAAENYIEYYDILEDK